MASTELTENAEVKNVSAATINLCNHGDVTLIIGKQRQGVLVSVSILRQASSVWHAMFNERWAESQTNEIAFPDDDVEAMLLVLRIAHMQFKDIPRAGEVNFRGLVNITVVCDKYDLVHLIRPFLQLYKWEKQSMHCLLIEGFEEWLFIAWTLGWSSTFKDLAEHLVNRAQVTKDGQLLVNGNHVGQNMPPEIIESILQVRQDAVNKIVDHCRDTFNNVLDGHVCRVPFDEYHACRSTILGTITKALYDLHILPHGQEEHINAFTLEQLQEFMRDSVTLYPYEKIAHEPSNVWDRKQENRLRQSHEPCAEVVDWESIVDEIIDNLPSPVLDSHRKHMEEQAKKH